MKLALVPSVSAVFLALPAAAQTVWHVDDDTCPAAGSGTALDPFCGIQAALDAATAGDTVLVGPGIYVEHVVMKAGVDLIGSGAATTTIDAGGSGSTVIGADAALLDGFLITGAGGLNEHAISLANGTSPTISNNTISGNKADGIVLLQSAAVIVGNTIVGDPTFGGGCPCNPILSVQSSPTIAGNVIDGSDPNGNLDAIYVTYNSGDMSDSFLIENNLILGRLFMLGVSSVHPLSNATRGNLILNTNGFSETVSLAFSEDAGLIANNTLVGGGGLFAQGSGTAATIENNVIAFGDNGIGWVATGAYLIKHNDVYGNTTDYSGLPDQTGINGNIAEDPLFADVAGHDYHLRFGSPCTDAGSSTVDPGPVDLDGTPRVLDGNADGSMRVDMGASEFTLIRLGVSGAPTPGGQLSFTASGHPSLLGLVAVGTAPGAFVLPPYGAILFDPSAAFFILAPLQPLPFQVVVNVPLGIPTPTVFHAQAVGLHVPSGFGNFSNRVSVSIQGP